MMADPSTLQINRDGGKILPAERVEMSKSKFHSESQKSINKINENSFLGAQAKWAPLVL